MDGASLRQLREVISFQDKGVLVAGETTETDAAPKPTSPDVIASGVKSAEKNLSLKLNQLSLEERNKAIFELHGVADVEQETTEMLDEKLRQMSGVVDSFEDTMKTASYRKALEMDKDYVDKKIKLLCLRADYYNVEKAAARMITFFNFKKSLFGDEKLGREICLKDLNAKGREALDSGVFHLLQQRDRAGRGITMTLGKKSTSLSPEGLLQAFYYVHMSALRDEEIQKTGIVHIYYGIGQETYVSDRPAKAATMFWLIPFRLVAMHYCYDTSVMGKVAQKFCQAMEAHHLCRFRAHKGSVLECIFNLMTFGIPKEVLPIREESGDWDLRAHHRWIETMQHREKASTKNSTSQPEQVPSQSKEVIVPGPMDIIVGLGRQSANTAGYLKFRDMLQSHRAEYESGDRFAKTVLASHLAKKLRDGGCRFVRCTPDGVLSECDEVEARNKVSHAFRNMRQLGTRRNRSKSRTSKRSISQR